MPLFLIAKAPIYGYQYLMRLKRVLKAGCAATLSIAPVLAADANSTTNSIPTPKPATPGAQAQALEMLRSAEVPREPLKIQPSYSSDWRNNLWTARNEREQML